MKVAVAWEIRGSHGRQQWSWWRVQEVFIKEESLVPSLVKLLRRAGGESEMAAKTGGSPTGNKLKTFPQNSARCFW